MNSNGKKISLRRAVTEADMDLLQEVLRDPTVNVQEYINSALSVSTVRIMKSLPNWLVFSLVC